jgi:hypothetical protein
LPSAERAAAFLTFFVRNPVCGTGEEGRHLFNMTRQFCFGFGELRLQRAFELVSLQKLCRRLFALGTIAVLIGSAAHAQNLDEGKSAARLFADGCATCHHTARGLAKGRFNLTLYLFLQEHYVSNSSSAWALTSYLESVDSARRGQSRTAAVKPAAASTARTSMRPPMPVPER